MSSPAPTATSTLLNARTWTVIVGIGLIGQVAWTIENMYLNLFVYEQITADPRAIAAMVAVSALAAAVTTMAVGAWSDRVGRRRVFIAVGYFGWGVLTAAFGLFSGIGDVATTGTTSAAGAAIGLAVAGVIALDALLTVFGSAANDAAFNAWVTDSTVPANRGRVDGVLSVLPLISMLLVFVALDPLTKAGEWPLFFGIVGGITSAAGVAAWFLVADRGQPRASGSPLGAVADVLRPAAVRANPVLYATLAIMAVLGISAQVFMPYLIIYLQYYLKLNFALVLGLVLVSAAALTVVGGRIMDAVGKAWVLVPAVGLLILGLIGLWFARDLWAVVAVGIPAITGMLVANAAVAAMVRDATPADRAGAVQGLRIIAMVLIPMVIGPSIGAAVISGAGQTYVDLGVVRPVPGPEIFPVAALILVVIPLLAWHRSRLVARAG